MKKIILLIVLMTQFIFAVEYTYNLKSEELIVEFSNIKINYNLKTEDKRVIPKTDKGHFIFLNHLTNNYISYDNYEFNLTEKDLDCPEKIANQIDISKFLKNIDITYLDTNNITNLDVTMDYKFFKRDPNNKETLINEGTISEYKKTIFYNNKKDLKLEKYTDTYQIDEVRECIDGESWITKYKQKSGKKCDWTIFKR